MKNKKNFVVSMMFFAMFIILTLLVKLVDVKAIGPLESKVGFATINRFVHEFFGVNMTIYTITDWLGLVPIAVVFGFGVFGLLQWIKRKNLRNVDTDIIMLGIFYVVVMAVFVFFEKLVINYRPVLVEGVLEASYPSSTTMLCMCVMPTFAMQIKRRMNKSTLKRCLLIAVYLFTIFMVVARLVSGVHWFSDIVGGAFFSIGACKMYGYFA